MSLLASMDPGINFNGNFSIHKKLFIVGTAVKNTFGSFILKNAAENCLKNLLNTSLPTLGDQLSPENHLRLLWNRSSQYLGTDLVSVNMSNMSIKINLTFVVSVAPQQEQDNDENCDSQSCSHSNYHEFMTIRS